MRTPTSHFQNGPSSFAILLFAAAVSAIVPTNRVWAACPPPTPPPSYCGGDAGCVTVFCSSDSGTWDCRTAALNYPCGSGGSCDGFGTCTSNPPITPSTYNGTSCGCINAQ
jgi:hypothetical protein